MTSRRRTSAVAASVASNNNDLATRRLAFSSAAAKSYGAATYQPNSLPVALTCSSGGGTAEIAAKVMLLGDTSVGKTCLMIKFNDGHFLAGTYISTVGVDFRNKTVHMDGVDVRLQVWDTAGQERFRSITNAYYRDAHALLLVYDITSRASFHNTRDWLSQMVEFSHADCILMLIGNKSDKVEDRQVSVSEGDKLATEFGAVFLETSAKTGSNVDLAFTAVARKMRYKSHTEDGLNSRIGEQLGGAAFSVQQYVRSRSKTCTTPSSCSCGTS